MSKRTRSKTEHHWNMNYIRHLSKANMLSKGETYEPKVSERFLEEWLDFPRHGKHFVFFNTLHLMTKWLLWTNKSIASLDPANPSIRDRLSNTISQLCTVSGLFLVMAVACFTVPPEPRHGSPELQKILLDVYGVLLFTSMVCSLFYIGYALTALYPVLQSIRDDIAFDGYEHLKRGLGGYELFMFNIGMHALALSFFISAYLLYSPYAVLAMVVIAVVIYAAMHLGLSNDPVVLNRAELMAQYILRQVPNHLLDDSCEETRASLDIAGHNHLRHHLRQLKKFDSDSALESSARNDATRSSVSHAPHFESSSSHATGNEVNFFTSSISESHLSGHQSHGSHHLFKTTPQPVYPSEEFNR